MKKLLCIDGNSILNRSFYGIRLLTTKDGFPTNALYGFVNIISKQIEELKPDYAAVAFDLKAPTFRHKMYGAYKAGRHAMPDELARQMPEAKILAKTLGLHVLELEGYEADDILGTLARLADESQEECVAYVLTGDRDSLQLIGPHVHVLLATNAETIDMNESAFTEKYGVLPSQFVDVKALMGDSSDNIPGISGVGEKTALRLISEFGSLDNIYEQLPNVKLTPSLRTKIETGHDSAYLSKELATICKEVPLGLSLDDIKFLGMNRPDAKKLFLRYEFLGFIKRFLLADESTDENVSTDANVMPNTAEESTQAHLTVGYPNVRELNGDGLKAIPAGKYAVSLEGDASKLLYMCDGTSLFYVSLAETDAVGEFLTREDISIICYDCKNIYKELTALEIPYREFYFDVMLASYVINSLMESYSIEKLTVSYLSETPKESCAIAWYVARMWEKLAAELESTNQSHVFFDIEMPLASVLADMEIIGFMIDRNSLFEYGVYLDTVLSQLEERIYMMAGHPFNINSPKQLGEVLFEELMLPAEKKTKTGYSTGAEILEKLRRYHPIIDDILDYRQLAKLKGTYVDGLLKVADGEGRIHTTFKQTGTATGRLSSAEPNLQNIPIRTELGRELRKFFVPSTPSRVLIDADYSQIELRLLADIAGDSAMRDAFISGLDIHTSTAMRVFGVSSDNVTIELRKKAKAINFGIMYGMGEFSLSQDLHISRAEAKAYIDSYLHSYPDIDEYLKNIVKTAYEQGYVTTLLGRRRLIPELSDSKKMIQKFGERVAMNSPIQGTAADIIKIAMIRTYKHLKSSGIDAKMILQVHDELILEASEDAADEALSILKEEMENAVKLSVPLDADAHIGKNWYEAH